jgi:hypothetical protein
LRRDVDDHRAPREVGADRSESRRRGAAERHADDAFGIRRQLFHGRRDRFGVPVSDDKLEEVPYAKFEEGSPELEYMRARRMDLGGYLPARRRKADPLAVPELGAFERFLYYLGPTPKIVFFPIMIMWFGVGVESKIAMGTLSAFFPVVLNTAAGMRQIESVLIRVGRSFRLNGWQMVSKIYLPAMREPIVNGVSMAMRLSGTAVATNTPPV